MTQDADSSSPVFDCVRIADDDNDVAFWACVLEVTVHDVRYAMRLVGDNVSAITRYLKGQDLDGVAAIH